MARRDNDDGKELRRKKGHEQEQEQEQEQESKKEAEPEHARAQNQYGNATLAAMMANQNAGAGGTGVEVEPLRKKGDHEKEGQDYGGEADPVDNGPLTEFDLTRSWNPGATAPTDRPRFLEPMPEDELPPEDPAFLDAIRGEPAPRLRSAWTVDALLQPSAEVLAISLRGWTRAVHRWSSPGVADRSLARVAMGVPLLQDPTGRVLLARARCASIASCALLRSPLLRGVSDVPTAALLDFALELESRDHRVRGARFALGAEELPNAGKLFRRLVTGPETVAPTRLADGGLAIVAASIDALVGFTDPAKLVPELLERAEEDDDEDDPLGLDDVVVQMTGGPRDRQEPVLKAAIQGAERMAMAATTLRVQMAGAAFAVSEVAKLWSSGAPATTLAAVMDEVDKRIDECVSLLLEIARAAQRRAVPPKGLRAGLRRAAAALAKAYEQGRQLLADVVGGILPEGSRARAPVPEPDDGLAEAWRDGEPARALSWLMRGPDGYVKDAAIALTDFAIGDDPAVHLSTMSALRTEALANGDPLLANAAGTCLGACLLRAGDAERAAKLAAEQLELGKERRNGSIVADAALLGVEAAWLRGDVDGAERRRRQAGALLWHMGARSGLTLLARWTPPVEEADDEEISA